MGAIISRAQWGARYRNGVGSRPVGSLEKYLHHDAFGSSPGESASFAQDAAHMRAIERVGQQRFGGGISYTFGISRAGRIFQGAGVNRISYHSGGARNTRGTGWVLFGNYERYKLTAKQLAAIVWLLQHGVTKGWWGDPAFTSYHQQFRATACPGKNAISQFKEINRRGRGGSVKAPSAGAGKSKGVWPKVKLPVTNKHTTASHNAWVKLMADVGYKQAKLGLALQHWLRDLGYYKGLLDGYFGPRSVRALQSFLVDKKLLPSRAYVDGDRGRVTVNAEIRYLNDQAKHY